MTPAIFLDRDGVIVENRPNYILSWADVAVYPQALAALARLRQGPHIIVVITNQSAIGRGLLTPAAAQAVNTRLIEVVAQAGGRIDAVYLCPHTPDDACACRKPRPGLLLQAAREMSLDLAASLLIGDALTDLQAGLNAGVGQVALVRTGRGQAQSALPAATAWSELPLFEDVYQALDNLVGITNR